MGVVSVELFGSAVRSPKTNNLHPPFSLNGPNSQVLHISQAFIFLTQSQPPNPFATLTIANYSVTCHAFSPFRTVPFILIRLIYAFESNRSLPLVIFASLSDSSFPKFSFKSLTSLYDSKLALQKKKCVLSPLFEVVLRPKNGSKCFEPFSKWLNTSSINVSV